MIASLNILVPSRLKCERSAGGIKFVIVSPKVDSVRGDALVIRRSETGDVPTFFLSDLHIARKYATRRLSLFMSCFSAKFLICIVFEMSFERKIEEH